jgi:AGCS family alanine or glycine:cation symporter
MWMTPTIVAISKDYFKKKDSGEKVEYKAGDCEIQGKSEDGVWD